MFPWAWHRADLCAASPVDHSEDLRPRAGARSVGQHLEGQDDFTRVVIFQLEHSHRVGDEFEDHVVSRELDVVSVQMELAFLVADDVDPSRRTDHR